MLILSQIVIPLIGFVLLQDDLLKDTTQSVRKQTDHTEPLIEAGLKQSRINLCPHISRKDLRNPVIILIFVVKCQIRLHILRNTPVM